MSESVDRVTPSLRDRIADELCALWLRERYLGDGTAWADAVLAVIAKDVFERVTGTIDPPDLPADVPSYDVRRIIAATLELDPEAVEPTGEVKGTKVEHPSPYS